MGMRKIDRNKILTTVVLSIILGTGSGILATALTSSYLSDYAIQLSELTTPLRIATDAPRVFPDDINDAIYQINDVINKSVASAFINSTKGQNGFTAKDLVASGVVVITTSNRDKVHMGLTVSSFASVSLSPPLVSFCIF